MKSRIVYPSLWSDPRLQNCSKYSKLLFAYLITSPLAGLTRFVSISDKQIQFDTDLNKEELDKAKKELAKNRLMFFYESWSYHNHDLAYIDYEGRDRVLEAKEKELSSVPQEIKDIFNQLITSYQLVLNHKSEIINPKSETLNTGVSTSSVAVSKPNPRQALITLAAEIQGIRQFTNYAKQLKAISLIEKAGHTLDDVRFVIEEMGKEDYWKTNTFDLMNVYNNIDRYLNRTVMKKGVGKK